MLLVLGKTRNCNHFSTTPPKISAGCGFRWKATTRNSRLTCYVHLYALFKTYSPSSAHSCVFTPFTRKKVSI